MSNDPLDLEDDRVGVVMETNTSNSTITTGSRSGTFLRTISTRLCGIILLDKYEIDVGDTVVVSWEINSQTSTNRTLEASERDWIGLFYTNDLNPESVLSHRSRGDNLDYNGQINWTVTSDYITEPLSKLCFCFYTSNNTLLAQSEDLTVNNHSLTTATPTFSIAASSQTPLESNQPISIIVKELSCFNLRMKSFGPPDPYVKLKIVPGKRLPKLPYHGRQQVETGIQENTVSPTWPEEFSLQAIPTDVLEIEVRDKFTFSRPSASHFLGKAKIDLSCIRNNHISLISCPLQKRVPTDRVAGRIGLKIINELIPPTSNSPPPAPVHQYATPTNSDESINLLFPPERPADRINWVRRTLHGSSYRSNNGRPHPPPSSRRNHRHSSVIVRRSSDDNPSLVQSLQVDPRPHITGSHNEINSSLTDSLPPFSLGRDHQDRLVVDHFMARSSRNQVMRQNSVPVQRRSPPYTHTEGLEPIHVPPVSSPTTPLIIDLVRNNEVRNNEVRNNEVQICNPLGDDSIPSPDIIVPIPSQSQTESSSNDPDSSQTTGDISIPNPPQTETDSSQAPGEISVPSPSEQTETDSSPAPGEISVLNPSDQTESDSSPTPGNISIPDSSQTEPETISSPSSIPSPVHIMVSDDVPQTTPTDTPTLNIPQGDTAQVEDPPLESIPEEQRSMSSTDSSLLSVGRTFERIDSVDESLSNNPAFKFITRPDLYEFIKSTGKTTILQNLTLLQLIQSIRSDHTLLTKYINSKKLVIALNEFAQTDCQLPDGWERKVDKTSGKAVYLDHNNHMTTFIDPRLPYDGSMLKKVGEMKSGMMRNRPVYNPSEPPPRSSSDPPPVSSNEVDTTILQRSETTPTTETTGATPPAPPPPPPLPGSTPEQTSYSQNVVNFLRQPDIHTILMSRYEEPISQELRDVIDRIVSGGVATLEQIQSQPDETSFQLVIILSLFEEDIAHQLFEPAPQPVPATPSVHITTPRLSTSSLARHTSRTNSTPRPPPRLAPPPMDLDQDTYCSIPLINIIEFFQLPSVYNIVLRNQGSIQPIHRRYISEFSGLLTFELSLRLSADDAARRFIYELREEIRRSTNVIVEETTTNNSEEEGTMPSAQEVLNYMSQQNILEVIENIRGVNIGPDERSIINVCGLWDVSLIDFELNRESVLRELVRNITTQIRQYNSAPMIPPPPPPPPPLPSTRMHVPISGTTQRATLRRIESSDSDTDYTDPASVSDSDSLGSDRVGNVPDNLPPGPTRPQVSGRKKKNQEFVNKLQSLQTLLDTNRYAYNSYSTKNFNIRRDHLLEDAYKQVMTSSAKSLRGRKCHVTWDKEEGLDYGGPQREFFFKLSRHLFNPYYGLFEYTSQGSYTVQISRYSVQVENCLQWFRFAGRVIGYSIIQNNLLDVFFARHVYKALLGRPFILSDVEALDVAFYNSLVFVMENDPAPLELVFTATEESFGEAVEKDLKPGGSKIAVTEENKAHYVDLMIQWKLCKGIEKQTEAMVEGLKEMLPLEYLQPFDSQELEWVIAGTPEIDMKDWKNNTQYWGGYSKDHKVIKWFWEVMESCTDEEKLRMLQFATGTSSIPYEGFRALRGSSQQITKFTIDRYTGTTSSLPVAHTCFNRIDLPAYNSLVETREKVLYAILETDGFGNA